MQVRMEITSQPSANATQRMFRSTMFGPTARANAGDTDAGEAVSTGCPSIVAVQLRGPASPGRGR